MMGGRERGLLFSWLHYLSSSLLTASESEEQPGQTFSYLLVLLAGWFA
jgi:hypothetical protein